MRESNFAFPAQNRACVCISSQLYDRRGESVTLLFTSPSSASFRRVCFSCRRWAVVNARTLICAFSCWVTLLVVLWWTAFRAVSPLCLGGRVRTRCQPARATCAVVFESMCGLDGALIGPVRSIRARRASRAAASSSRFGSARWSAARGTTSSLPSC